MKANLKWTVWLAIVAMLLVAAAARAQYMTGETVPQSQTVLDSYFVTNAIPTQLQYWELIDTEFYYIMSTYTNALAAAQSAAAAQTSSSGSFARVNFIISNPGNIGNFNFLATNGFTNEVFTSVNANPNLFYYSTDYFAVPVTDPYAFATVMAISNCVATNFESGAPSYSSVTYGMTSNYFWFNAESVLTYVVGYWRVTFSQ